MRTITTIPNPTSRHVKSMRNISRGEGAKVMTWKI
jgi:hypothetical protein